MSLVKHTKLPQKIMVLTIAALTMLTFGLIAPAHGQNTYEAMETQESVHVPDAKLKLFIQVQEAVNTVQDQYRQAVQNPGSETSDSLQRTMGEEVIHTIEAHGMTVDEYNTILAEVQKTDADTARRYHDMTRTK